MKRSICVACAVAMAFVLIAGEARAGDCKAVRGEGVVVQPGGLGTNWVGPVSLRMRGQRLEGEATVFIDPLIWLAGPAPPPLFHFAGFDWVKLNFGSDGYFTIWEMAYFEPKDPFLIEWTYEGYGRLGWAYLGYGSYGPWGTGMFEKVTGELDVKGTMWLTHPDPPNRVEFRFKGKLCGV
jgi:hypothetical protein